ncbi:MAG TPA: FIST N-terminal domain-containing protein [Phycisphaerales bacterium]|nr:FIST N-terminal domain-containing protein [Phycisphaerales bacterium]
MSTATLTTPVTLQYTSSGWTAPFPALDSSRTLVLVFGGSPLNTNDRALQDLRAAFPTSHVVGCTTSGEILNTNVHDDTLTVAIMRFAHTDLATAYTPVRSAADSFNAGAALAHQLARPRLRAVFVLSDGLAVNGTDLAKGLSANLPKDVVITGGLAGDGTAFKQTHVLHNGTPTPNMICAVGIYGDRVHVTHGVKGGWSPFGPERAITKSQGNVLLELDNKPALELYKKYLADRAAQLPASGLLFPLTIRETRGSQRSLVRTILAVDETNQSMTFAGDIPQGWTAQLMRANFDWIVSAAQDSASDAINAETLDTPACLTIAVSCVGRRIVLGDRTADELEAAVSALPAGSPLVGFYSYGELAPQSQGACCDLHNQTMTITTIREA